jgi:hypothetical protein
VAHPRPWTELDSDSAKTALSPPPDREQGVGGARGTCITSCRGNSDVIRAYTALREAGKLELELFELCELYVVGAMTAPCRPESLDVAQM